MNIWKPTGNGVIKCLLRQVAGLIRSIQNLIVEDREVERKAETNGVGRGQLGLGDLGRSLVSLQGLVGRVLPLVANGELGEVAVVITLPKRGRQLKFTLPSREVVEQTSCDRRPWTRHSLRMGSGARQGR